MQLLQKEISWHALPLDQVGERLETEPGGLDSEEAKRRLDKFGPNALKPPKRRSLIAIVLGQLRSPLIYLLLLAGTASVIMGDAADAAFIFVILIINSAIGATQEARADANTAALRSALRTLAKVRRDGETVVVDGRDLVPGDVVLVEAGDRVPADLRLIRSVELLIDESSLTGESALVAKEAYPALQPETLLADRGNQLFAGTVVRVGRCEGFVVATGADTQIGQIAETVSGPGTEPPLTKRLDGFTRALGVIALVLVAAIVAPRLLAGAELKEVLLVGVALAVSIIPEGLPVAVTVALSIATRRMAKRNVIVRHLPAVEGLGACTVIATDKTGTLTVNEQTAERVWIPGYGAINLAEGEDNGGESLRAELTALGRSAALCNDAWLDVASAEGGVGDTVDIALLWLAEKNAIDASALRAEAPRLDEVPFSAERRYSATLNRHEDGHFIHVKGAPEVILPLSMNAMEAAREVEIMAGEGYRVLAIATKGVEVAEAGGLEEELTGLTLLGLVGFIDPLRPEARQAVADCHRAGVEVRMITGDHPGTALAIARQLGLATHAGEVVTGKDLMLAEGDADAMARVAAARVFARVEPSQKVQIVEGLRAAGHFVAMTGDGVNDAPALVRADIGVSMGRDGTDAARDASDLVLTDDNFASIVAGIEEGRAAYANIRKVIYLLISTGAAEAIIFFLSVATGLPLPLGAVQLLWLNLVTNGGQDVALAFEKPEPDLLDRPPRRPSERILDGLLIRQVAVSGVYMGVVAFAVFAWALSLGVPEAEARSLLLFLMVLFENVHAFNVRSETRSAFQIPLWHNWPLMASIAVAQTLHLAAPYVPVLRDVLEVQPVSLSNWAMLLGVAASLLVVMEVDKWLRRGPQGARTA